MRKALLIIKMVLSFPLRIVSTISPFAIIRNSKYSKLSAISLLCNIYFCEIGKYTYIGSGTKMYHTIIGNFCSVADGCIIGPGEHPTDKLSTSPVFYSKNNIFGKSFYESDFKDYKKTIIGNDVWIGTHVFIKSGVKIGDGSIIGAYSVITKDVEPYNIVAGNPAKVIKQRFDKNKINYLLEMKWWNWRDDKIEENIDLFI